MARSRGLNFMNVNIRDYEVENLFEESLIIVVISTYENGSAPHDAAWFFRLDPTPRSHQA